MVPSRPDTNTTGLALKLLAALALAACFCITNSAYDNYAVKRLSEGFLDLSCAIACINQAVSTVLCPCGIMIALHFVEERIYRCQPLAI